MLHFVDLLSNYSKAGINHSLPSSYSFLNDKIYNMTNLLNLRVMDMISLQGKTNLFDKRVSGYHRSFINKRVQNTQKLTSIID